MIFKLFNKRANFLLLLFTTIWLLSVVAYAETIELEIGNESLEIYRTYQLSEAYTYKIIDETIVSIDATGLMTALTYGETLVEVYENALLIDTHKVIVYFVGNELMPLDSVLLNVSPVSYDPSQEFKAIHFIARAEVPMMFARVLKLFKRVISILLI